MCIDSTGKQNFSLVPYYRQVEETHGETPVPDSKSSC